MSVTAVVGAQFGSEGKGLVVERIASKYDVHIRTGAPNAGHTYYIDSAPGEVGDVRTKVVARSVPVGACVPGALLVIGPGALIDLDLLLMEVDTLDALGLDVSSRLCVDQHAFIIDKQRHHMFEGGIEGEAHRLIGSTGEGVGPARMAKMARNSLPSPRPSWSVIEQVKTHEAKLREHGIDVCDTAQLVNSLIDKDAKVLLEGTQGSGLSVTHGSWPYVTSNDTNAAQLAADAGIAPGLVTESIVVARTYPIRVAGNSGPLPHEVTWERIGVPEERTTVTKKVRRVAAWHPDMVRRAVMLNRSPRTRVALMFSDYVFKSLSNRDSIPVPMPDGLPLWLATHSVRIGAPIGFLGTGPDSLIELAYSDVANIVPRADRDMPWPSHDDAFQPDA